MKTSKITLRLENGNVINYTTVSNKKEAVKIASNLAGDILAITSFALGLEDSKNAKIYVNDEFICNF